MGGYGKIAVDAAWLLSLAQALRQLSLQGDEAQAGLKKQIETCDKLLSDGHTFPSWFTDWVNEVKGSADHNQEQIDKWTTAIRNTAKDAEEHLQILGRGRGLM